MPTCSCGHPRARSGALDPATGYFRTRAWRAAASFGHPGSGGSIAFGDPDNGVGVGFGYVTNLWNYRPDDPRAANLAKAVRACLG